MDLIHTAEVTPDSVIDLRLTGRLNLNRIALDQTLAAQEIQSAAEVFAVAIDLAGLDVGGFLPGSELSRQRFFSGRAGEKCDSGGGRQQTSLGN